jgi:DNA-binding transcriptional MocR family regulator
MLTDEVDDTPGTPPTAEPTYNEQLEGPPPDGPSLWCAALENSNKQRLRNRYDRLTAILDDGGIRYLPAGAGLFLWIDLRPMLEYRPGEAPIPRGGRGAWEGSVGVAESMFSSAEAQAERALYLRLIHDFGLMLTPGASMRAEEPGMFRCVFSAATDDGFEVTLERFGKLGRAAKAS